MFFIMWLSLSLSLTGVVIFPLKTSNIINADCDGSNFNFSFSSLTQEMMISSSNLNDTSVMEKCLRLSFKENVSGNLDFGKL